MLGKHRVFEGMNGRRAAVLAASVLCAIGAAACGSASSGSGGGGGTSLTLGLPVPDSTFVSAYLAEDQGLFKKEGLNVKLVTFQGGSDLTKAVVSGSVQVGINGLGGIMPAIQQGQPLKVIYGGFNELSYKWYALPSINSIQQAKSKTWGVTKVGSDTDYLTRYLLAKNGINPDTVNIVGGGASASRIAAMGAGQIQVSVDSNPGDLEMAKKGYHLLASESQFTSTYPDHMIFAKTSYIQHNQATIAKLLSALVKGMQMEKSDPKLAQSEMVKNDKISPSFAPQTYAGFVNGQYPDGRLPNAQAMNTFWQIGIQNKEYKAAIPESKWLDTKWIASYPSWVK